MTSSARWQHVTALAMLAVMAAWLLHWATTPLLGSYDGDNAVYWLTANHLEPAGQPHPAAAHFARTSVFPPLYPALLAWAGGGGDLLTAHLATAVMVVLGFAASAWFARSCGLPMLLASSLAVLCAASRGALLEHIELHSEHLYLALSAGALALVRADASSRRLALAAACIGAATLTRSFGLALLAAFLLWLAIARPRAWPVLALLASAPALLFALVADSSTQYATNFLDIYAANGVLAQLGVNARALGASWLRTFAEPGQPGFHPILPAALALLAALGCACRLARGACDAWYALAALTLLMVWPYPAEHTRFLYALLPLFAVHALCAMQPLGATGARSAHVLMLVPPLLLLAAELPFLALFAARYSQPPPGALAPYVHSAAWYYRDTRTALATVGYQAAVRAALAGIAHTRRVPDGDCMLAPKTAIVALFGRQVVHGLPPYRTRAEDLARAVRRSPCSFLFMLAAPTPTFPEAFFPFRQLRDELHIVTVYPNPLRPQQPAAILAQLPPAPP